MITAEKAAVTPAAIKAAIRERALGLGFDAAGFAAPELLPAAKGELAEYIGRGLHGDMGWLAANAERRADPKVLWPQARSAVVVGQNYGPEGDPLAGLADRDTGTISIYAQGRDYHHIIGAKLKRLGRYIHETFGAEVKVFVDTAPLMEKPLAERAGVGWQGKHTNLVSRRFGSWLFLGEVLTTLPLAPDPPEADHCGSCRACLDVCPTRAFLAPYRIDARRCISYLTIEHKGHIAEEFRAAMGNRIYGCDDCLAVCPWNKYATPTREAALLPREELTAPKLAALARLDAAAFRAMFAGTAIKRTGRDRFLRNVLIALGNSGDTGAIGVIEALLHDPSPLVRAMAAWALSRLLPDTSFASLRARYRPREPDAAVCAEWDAKTASAAK